MLGDGENPINNAVSDELKPHEYPSERGKVAGLANLVPNPVENGYTDIKGVV